MSSAIFFCTFRRFMHWTKIIPLFIVVTSVGFILGGLSGVESPYTEEMARVLLFGPIFPMALSYSAICPQVANSQRLKDGEYLSLLFTRPISKFGYVLTKWLTGTAFVLAAWSVLLIFTLTTCAILKAAFGLQPRSILDGYTVADMILNAFSFSALSVFISCLPPRFGIAILVTLVYLSVFAGLGTGAAAVLLAGLSSESSHGLAMVSETISSFFRIGIDTYHSVNSAASPILSLVIYCSNVVLLLTAGCFILSMREFFYAND